jgi:hypothetical protein
MAEPTSAPSSIDTPPTSPDAADATDAADTDDVDDAGGSSNEAARFVIKPLSCLSAAAAAAAVAAAAAAAAACASRRCCCATDKFLTFSNAGFDAHRMRCRGSCNDSTATEGKRRANAATSADVSLGCTTKRSTLLQLTPQSKIEVISMFRAQRKANIMCKHVNKYISKYI